MRRLLVLVTLVTLIVLLSPRAALMQDAPPVFCGDLSSADCALLDRSAAAMRTLESAGFRFDVNLQTSSLPGLGFPFDLRLNGAGQYALDAASLNALDPTPDWDGLPGWVEAALKLLRADATVVLHLPTALVDVHAGAGAAFPSKVGFDLRLAEGFAYFSLDKLAELGIGEGLPVGWLGIDAAGFYRRLLEQQTPLAAPDLGRGAAAALADPALLAAFTRIERLEDSTDGSQTLAVFRTTTDLGQLLADPAEREALRAALLANLERLGLTAEEVDPLLEAYTGLFQGLVIETTEYVGVDDHYVHRATLALAWSPDLNALDRLAGVAPTLDASALSVWLNAQISLEAFNAAAPAAAPDEAFIIPLNQLAPAPPSAGAPPADV